MSTLDPNSVAVGMLVGAAIVMLILGASYAWDAARAKVDQLLFDAHVETALGQADESPAHANVRAFDSLGREANR